MAAVPVGKSANPLLARYLSQLTAHPLRTKSATSGTLSFLQEVLGSNLAGLPVKRPAKDASFLAHVLARYHINLTSLLHLFYGALISAPLSHVLNGWLQRAFAGRAGKGAKVGQLLASNLLVAPIQNTAFLASMAVINGAKSTAQIKAVVRGGLMSMMRATWVISPTSLVLAQSFVPMELWVPFFNLIQFTIGTYFNMTVKKSKLAAARKQAREAQEKAARDQARDALRED